MDTFSVQLFYNAISIQWKYIAVRNNTDLSAGDLTILLQAGSQPGKALFKINGITLVFSRFYQ